MGSLLAYSGTTTKIRAIQSRLLKPRDYEEMAGMKTVSEALSYLKQKPAYRELFQGKDESQLHRNEVENMLVHSIHADFQKIYRFSNVRQRKFLDLYFGRYEIAILKRYMRMMFDHRSIREDLAIFTDFFHRHSKIDLDKVASSRTNEEFVENLKGSIYYEPLKRLANIKSPTLWDYEMSMDLFYFRWFWEKGTEIFSSKSDQRIFEEGYGVKIDLLNMQWIARAKKYYHMESADIYAMTIPVTYRLKKEDIHRMVESASMDELNGAIRKTYYGRKYDFLNVETLDESYVKIRHSVHSRNARNDPYSPAVIISYLYEKEHEIDKLTMALECVHYRLPQNETLKYIMG